MQKTYGELKATREEIELLDRGGREIYKFGHTEITCPRCGKRIVLDDLPYPVRCEDPNCIKLTVRGL